MNKVIITFRDKTYEMVSREFAETTVLPAYSDYAEKRVSKLLQINNRWINVDQISQMEDEPTPKSAERILSINEAINKSIEEEKDEGAKTLKEKQLKIWRHNLDCIREKRMEDYIYYKIESGKLLKTSREEAEKRLEDYRKQQILSRSNVTEVVKQAVVR